ncbi:MAG: serine/threonine-protein kinase [Crocosphaera sp.]|nr:serine/threonine-protein kinase [Crocosphaera sp.]
MVWQTGQKLQRGKYQIIKVLGRGGFGITYHARHIPLNTEVVIKTPDLLQKKDIEYEQYVQQFQDEAQRLAKFSAKPHPHIVKVRDYFLEDTLPCLVMDFIRGQTLMEIIKTQGPLSEAQCLIYIRQISKALQTIHKAKMVHRDAHPGNIMIQDGQAILIDFGIAKNIIPATHSVTDKAANPSFAPYEQIYRGSKERQYTIDVYTLAATFYYAVTGERPTPSMERKLNDKSVLIPPKQINGQLSEHINEAILKGMALEKEDRPQSISAWLGLLATLQPPPSVGTEYHKDVIKPQISTKSNNLPHSRDILIQIPWIRLNILFLLYAIYGAIIAVTQSSFWAWVVTLTLLWTVVVAIASSVAIAWVWTGVVAIIVAVTLGWPWASEWSLAWATAMCIAWSGEKLEQGNSSLFDRFLILSGVSLGGMGLGYLISWLM